MDDIVVVLNRTVDMINKARNLKTEVDAAYDSKNDSYIDKMAELNSASYQAEIQMSRAREALYNALLEE